MVSSIFKAADRHCSRSKNSEIIFALLTYVFKFIIYHLRVAKYSLTISKITRLTHFLYFRFVYELSSANNAQKANTKKKDNKNNQKKKNKNKNKKKNK